jgi:hypothetical protein
VASGDIFVNDKRVCTIAELKNKLNEIKCLHGAVWYYRENSSHSPHEVADEVFGLVMSLEMPISLSTKPDFSDWVDANGNSYPR